MLSEFYPESVRFFFFCFFFCFFIIIIFFFFFFFMWVGTELYAKGSSGPDFINVVRVRILSRTESGFGLYQSPGVSPAVFMVRVRILSSKSGSVSGSGFYSIRVRVRILSCMSGSGFYQQPVSTDQTFWTSVLRLTLNQL